MKHIDEIIQYGLSRPPSKAGMRLRSERELAEILGVDRTSVRRAMDRLARKGLLIRLHGSGTFVRKIPGPGLAEDGKWIEVAKRLADNLFASPTPRRRATRRERRLHLGVWGDFPGDLILAGMIDRAEELGHSLTVHSLNKERGGYRGMPEIAKELHGCPSDGYIVNSGYYWFFDRVFAMAWGQSKPPITYVVAGNPVDECQPLIEIDLVAAFARAVNIFVEEGFRRIGLIRAAYHECVHPIQAGIEDRNYARAIAGVDVDCMIVKVEFKDINSQSGKKAMAQLFDSDDPVEAVYVANDQFMPSVAEYLDEKGLVPGRDIALIAMSNYGVPLPPGYDWSRMEVDPHMLGRLTVDNVVHVICTAGEELRSFAHRATWLPGNTHSKWLAEPAEEMMDIEQKENQRSSK